MNSVRINAAFARAITAGTLGLLYIKISTTDLYFNLIEPEKIDSADWGDESISNN